MTIFEDARHGPLASLLWAYGEAEHHGRFAAKEICLVHDGSLKGEFQGDVLYIGLGPLWS